MADPVQNVGLTIAYEAYDRVAALPSGSVQIEGCSATTVALHAEGLFLRTIAYQEFDVCELSLSSYILATSRGGFPYVAIPVFPSRAFRHSAIYLNEASGIHTPADLRGKRVGVPENQMTAALWVRGMLSDCYGVRSQNISWRTGGLETKGHSEKIALGLPDGFDFVPRSVQPNACRSFCLLVGWMRSYRPGRHPASGRRRRSGDYCRITARPRRITSRRPACFRSCTWSWCAVASSSVMAGWPHRCSRRSRRPRMRVPVGWAKSAR